jgi:hypothetical protein
MELDIKKKEDKIIEAKKASKHCFKELINTLSELHEF